MSNKICSLRDAEYCLLKDERNLHLNHSNRILHIGCDKGVLEKTLNNFNDSKKIYLALFKQSLSMHIFMVDIIDALVTFLNYQKMQR